ncbi:MAG TPA: lysozyme [Hanamia sp.]
MITSEQQIGRLKSIEQFSARAYGDGKGHSSIGYGHQIQSNEGQLLLGSITQAFAEQLMRNDIAPLEDQINNNLSASPSQNQFDALIDFGFNCGGGALDKVIITWNNSGGDTSPVTAEIGQYVKWHNTKTGVLENNADLESRRAMEITLFNSILPPVLAGLVASPAVPLIAVCVFGLAIFYIFS